MKIREFVEDVQKAFREQIITKERRTFLDIAFSTGQFIGCGIGACFALMNPDCRYDKIKPSNFSILTSVQKKYELSDEFIIGFENGWDGDSNELWRGKEYWIGAALGQDLWDKS